MRFVLYLASLSAFVFAVRSLLGMLTWYVLYLFGMTLAGPFTPITSIALHTTGYLPYAFPVMRLFIWFKLRKISTPKTFQGIPFRVACIAAAIVAAVVVGYVFVATVFGSAGLSGIPLAMILMVCGFFIVISMPFVEIRDWLAFFRETRQVTD
ncbi:hypothetical protein KIK84_13985 [Curvibacter sp. CHRR-16]|uniref:hypothetical protein n=1 Tax=Curvibacter sp. CHRR-16 TaxID=2835872 RepID=UPI001BDAA7C4|nr:hypothetical protein [Curvibacter sp. CHRR-16]MBT0571435.1 hypothetical protein [Curvibacter sp. CHRR-16]